MTSSDDSYHPPQHSDSRADARSRRRRLSPQQEQLARVLGPLDGTEIPGGCDTCNAATSYSPLSPGVWLAQVRHDPACPTQQRREARRSS